MDTDDDYCPVCDNEDHCICCGSDKKTERNHTPFNKSRYSEEQLRDMDKCRDLWHVHNLPKKDN